MAWSLTFSKRATKQFQDLDRNVQKRVSLFIDERLLRVDDPKTLGKPLQGKPFSGLWSFRVGDYRLICSFQEQELLVLATAVGHRSQIYERLV